MKRKYADRPNWKRIIEKSYSVMYVDDENFCGHVAMNKIRDKLPNAFDKEILSFNG